MQYLGGKSKIRKQVSAFLESVRKPDQMYLEPFVGGAWILQEMSGRRIASDGNEALITMYKALQNGWIPPEEVSEELYAEYKRRQDNFDPLTAFIGIGCSFGGKWFGGYARSETRNYCKNAKNSLLKQLLKIKEVRFLYGEYQDHAPCECLIYCDPPYQGATQYGAFSGFNHNLFWQTMREWSKNNTVVISEYKAPDDFECMFEIPTKTDMRVNGVKEQRIEKLFMLKGTH